MKKHFCAYTKGIYGSSKLRNQLVHAETPREFENIFNDFFDNFKVKDY
jgi:hypothetical protein